MAFETYWDDQHDNLLCLRLFETTTWDEYHAGIADIITKISQTNALIDFIILGEASMPSGSPIPHLRNTHTRLETLPNFGVCVSVVTDSGSPVDIVFLRLLTTLFGINTTRYPTKQSKEDAIRYILDTRNKRLQSE